MMKLSLTIGVHLRNDSVMGEATGAGRFADELVPGAALAIGGRADLGREAPAAAAPELAALAGLVLSVGSALVESDPHARRVRHMHDAELFRPVAADEALRVSASVESVVPTGTASAVVRCYCGVLDADGAAVASLVLDCEWDRRPAARPSDQWVELGLVCPPL
jgi:hypothetical protein